MLKSRLPRTAVEIDLIVGEALEAGAEEIAQEARQRVRRRSSALHDAIHTESERDGVYVVAGDDDDVFYGHMIEHGTTRHGPFPFLVPALEDARSTVIDLVSAGLKRL